MMQRGEFLSHEPSTFTFQTSFLSPTREEKQRPEELHVFQNFTCVHRISLHSLREKRYLRLQTSTYSFHIHTHHSIKIKNLSHVFTKKTRSTEILPSFDDSEKSKLNLRQSATNRLSSNSIESRSSSFGSNRVAQRERGEETRTFREPLVPPFLPRRPRRLLTQKSGSSRGTSRVRGSGKYNAVSTARETSTNGGAEIAL